MYPEVSLRKVCKIRNGFAFKSSEFKKQGVPLVRISSFNDGAVAIDDKTAYLDPSYLQKRGEFIVEKGDVLIALSGATTGKFGIYNLEQPSLLNQRVGLIKRGSSNELNGKYFYYYLSILKDEILRKAGGVAQPNISTKAIGEFKIPLPTLPIQKKIAAILDAADAYRQKTKSLIEKYDELTQSLFLEMFGDPVRNEKGWSLISLGDYGDFKNGLNYRSNETGKRVKYIGVGDFKSRYKIEDIDKLSSISLATSPSQDYFLKNGDLLLVRSNGNRNLVGRCITVFPNSTSVTYSGFCIRYRIQSPNLSPMFLTFLFRNKTFKQYMLSGGRGANIQNINQKMLINLKIIKPDIEDQNRFGNMIKEIEDHKERAIKSMQKAEELFQSLLQKAFKGELIN